MFIKCCPKTFKDDLHASQCLFCYTSEPKQKISMSFKQKSCDDFNIPQCHVTKFGQIVCRYFAL